MVAESISRNCRGRLRSLVHERMGYAMAKRNITSMARPGSARRDTFMQNETKKLQALVASADSFDHNTNRGNVAEKTLSDWLRGWLEPAYTVSGGEIIDSIQAAGEPVARQQDCIVHASSIYARRYKTPGEVLVPIEEVVATVEVKLRVTKQDFESADTAASEILERKLALQWNVRGENGERVFDPWLGDPELFRVADQRDRLTFALFGFFGPANADVLVSWLKEAKAIELICCLDSGCVFRSEDTGRGKGKFCDVVEKDHALAMFADQLVVAVSAYEDSSRDYSPDRYAYAQQAKRHHDDPSHDGSD